MRRQQAEADALAGVQGMELPFAHVRPVKVEYPYSGDWAVQDPVAAEAAAKAKAEAGARAAVGVVGQGQGEGGERDGDDVLVPAEVVVEGVDAPVVAVLPVAVAVAVPPPNAEGEMGGEEDKRPDSPTASVTEGEQAPVVGEGQEEARRASTASFDPMAVEAEEGKTSVSPVPQQQKEAMPARPVFGGGEGEGEEGKEMDVSA